MFFEKEKSDVEIINDINDNIINFYRVLQNDFSKLQKEIKATLHSRSLHRKARVVYENPDMFDNVKRAWSVWVLSMMSMNSDLSKAFGYGRKKSTVEKKTMNKRNNFSDKYSERLQEVQIECTDALRIIKSRDTPTSFFYLDPPYYNSDMGHYDGYTEMDYRALLSLLDTIQGKFLLSGYPSPVLREYTAKYGWFTKEIEMNLCAGG